MSSTDTAAEETDGCCANCGMLEVDDVKLVLEECTDCHLVRYCGNNCRENHREQHEEECKIRKALLHDRKLFTQPDETHFGECPLCFLPMPIDADKSTFYTCCSEVILAVFMPITRAMEAIIVHSVASRCHLVVKKPIRE